MPMVGKQDQRARVNERIRSGLAPFGWSFCTGFEERLLLQPFLDLAVQMKGKRSSGLRATFWISHGCSLM